MSAATAPENCVRHVLEHAAAALAGSESAALDAQLLLAHALGRSRTWLYAWPEAPVDVVAWQRFEGLLAARAAGTPVAYLLGRREFWGLELRVSPAVLIPRPETELLVEAALALVPGTPALVADLGTGSGAIALALASERPQWLLHATELSPEALAVAEENRRLLRLENVLMFSGSWCEPLPLEGYDLILSNPPYIAADDEHLQFGDLRFEPRTALVADDGGLQDLRLVALQSRAKLKVDGWLILEHGWKQGAAVRDLLQEAGYGEVHTRRDSGDRDRMTMGRKP